VSKYRKQLSIPVARLRKEIVLEEEEALEEEMEEAEA